MALIPKGLEAPGIIDHEDMQTLSHLWGLVHGTWTSQVGERHVCLQRLSCPCSRSPNVCRESVGINYIYGSLAARQSLRNHRSESLGMTAMEQTFS